MSREIRRVKQEFSVAKHALEEEKARIDHDNNSSSARRKQETTNQVF
jgi:hypothetical protein